MKLNIEELTLIKQALEEALEDWIAQERGLQTAKMLFPEHYHMLYTEDELPSEALYIAELLLLKVSAELSLRERAGETVWWREEEILIDRIQTQKVIREETSNMCPCCNLDEEGASGYELSREL